MTYEDFVADEQRHVRTIQDIQFELIERSSFNSFDGEAVVASLKENPTLWKGVVIDRAGSAGPDARPYGRVIDLIKLRDIERNLWNVDTLYILASDAVGAHDELYELAISWDADEITWITGKEALQVLGGSFSPGPAILLVWWD